MDHKLHSCPRILFEAKKGNACSCSLHSRSFVCFVPDISVMVHWVFKIQLSVFLDLFSFLLYVMVMDDLCLRIDIK